MSIKSGGIYGEPSVAGPASTINDWIVTWHYEYSADDYDIYFAHVASSGVQNSGTISTTGDLEVRPCVTWCGNSNNQFIVAYPRASSWGGDFNIYSKTVTLEGTVGSEETIINTSSPEGSPEGTTIGGSYGQVVFVWDRDNGTDPDLYCRDWFFTEPPPPPPSKPINPSPSNGASSQSINVDINWSNGGGATSYDIYFGTNQTDVINGTGGTSKGNQAGTSYDPGIRSYSTPYYWRIDAKNSGGTTTGDIWSFTIRPLQLGQIQFSSSSYSVNENGTSISIEVTLTGGSDGTVSANYTTSDGTATAGSDPTLRHRLLWRPR